MALPLQHLEGPRNLLARVFMVPAPLCQKCAKQQGWGILLFLKSKTNGASSEISFALGRPDTLGLDIFHNRRLPSVNGPESSIISVMVDFARIIRTVSVDIYLSRTGPEERLRRAFEIEGLMVAWIDRLPSLIRPLMPLDTRRICTLRDPEWARMQRLVLQIRMSLEPRDREDRLIAFRILQCHYAPPSSFPDICVAKPSSKRSSTRRSSDKVYRCCRAHNRTYLRDL